MYATVRLIHLLSVSIFFGSIIGSYWWKYTAERTQNIQILRYALEGVSQVGRSVTAPSAGLLTITGIILLVVGGISQVSALWVQMLLAIWLTSAIIAIFYMDPLLETLKLAVTSCAELDGKYLAASAKWNHLSLSLAAAQTLLFIIATYRPTWGFVTNFYRYQ